jgi:hypothetical protein
MIRTINPVGPVDTFQGLPEFVRSGAGQKRTKDNKVYVAEMLPLESTSVVISEEARQLLAQEQAPRLPYDLEM